MRETDEQAAERREGHYWSLPNPPDNTNEGLFAAGAKYENEWLRSQAAEVTPDTKPDLAWVMGLMKGKDEEREWVVRLIEHRRQLELDSDGNETWASELLGDLLKELRGDGG